MDSQRYWKRQGGRVALRYNVGWWLAAFLNYSAAVCIVFACVLLILRQANVATQGAWIGLAVAIVLCALAAWLRNRRRFFTTEDGMVRLDVQLELNSRLTSAAAGVGEFPDASRAADGWRWRWLRMLAPVAGCTLFIAAAALIPIGRTQAAATVEPPSSWTQVESWVEQLEKSDVADKKTLEELREKLDSLKDRPTDEWYSQNSLEAGDNLRDQSRDAIRALQRDMQTAAMTLSAAEQFSEQMSAADMKSAQGGLDKALEGLELGKMPLNKELLEQLKKADLSKLKTLSPEQLAKMQKRLKEGAGVCKSCVGANEGDGYLMALYRVGQNPGNGAPTRGPGTVPLQLNPRETELNSKTTAGLNSTDLDSALPGDVVGMATGEHKVDKTAYNGPAAAGAASTGQGGDAVWRDSLTPEERGMLKRFFK
ncbi:MAG: hypothetical protein ACREKL_01915 [Chthoniobacterales bacterium]